MTRKPTVRAALLACVSLATLGHDRCGGPAKTKSRTGSPGRSAQLSEHRGRPPRRQLVDPGASSACRSGPQGRQGPAQGGKVVHRVAVGRAPDLPHASTADRDRLPGLAEPGWWTPLVLRAPAATTAETTSATGCDRLQRNSGPLFIAIRPPRAIGDGQRRRSPARSSRRQPSRLFTAEPREPASGRVDRLRRRRPGDTGTAPRGVLPELSSTGTRSSIERWQQRA